MTDETLKEIIGKQNTDKLVGLFDSSSGFKVIARRVQQNPKSCIPFHLDHSQKTLQVPLNSENEYEGGRVIYLFKDTFEIPKRTPGTCCIHTDNIIHGVTPITKGIRYSLFLLSLDEK